MEAAFTHYLMPKIEKMSENEVSTLLGTLKCDREQFPLIELEDAGLKGIDVQPGDVIRITRNEKDKEYYYRLVSD